MTLPFEQWIKREDYGDVEQLKRAYQEGMDYAKQIAESAYVEACGDAALRHVNYSKWERDTLIASRDALERECERLRGELQKEKNDHADTRGKWVDTQLELGGQCALRGQAEYEAYRLKNDTIPLNKCGFCGAEMTPNEHRFPIFHSEYAATAIGFGCLECSEASRNPTTPLTGAAEREREVEG